MTIDPDALDVAVSHATRLGGHRADGELGIQKMPFGYALILDADGIYFHWVRYDGQEGPELLNKWSAYHSAKWNYKTMTSSIHKPLVVTVGNT